MTSLRHKLWLGFGGLLLILLVVSLLSVVVLTIYSHTLDRAFRENYDSVVYCDAMNQALDELNLRAQGLAWDPPSATPIKTSEQVAKFQQNLDSELGNCTLQGEFELAQKLKVQWQQYQTDYASYEEAVAAARRDRYSSLLPQLEQMKEVARKISDMNTANMVLVNGQVKGTLTETRNALLVLALAGTLAAAILVGATSKSILNPLRALTHSANQIEKGNLDLNLDVRSGDEIGQLSEAFNSMTSRLREFRKLDAEKLIRTQQTTQLAIDSLPDGVFIVSQGGVVEISNRTARTHFGIEPGVTVGQLATSLKWLEPLIASVKNGHSLPELHGYQSAVQLFDLGHERFLLPRAVPMIGPDQKPIGAAVILVDVTQLRATDEAKSNLVSTVSHELRTPLTSIRMAISMLSGDKFGSLTPKQATLVKAAREDSDRLYRIIENLLNMSRMESGRVVFQMRSVSPRDIVMPSVDALRSAFNEKQILLEMDVPGDLPNVRADPAAVGSALTNLLTNAMKFTPVGGRVWVRVAREGDIVSFYVKDTGPGIPPEYASRIFDKFFRVPREDGPTGAGLGLAIAREVIESHGGKIELCRDNEQGSTFRFTLAMLT